MYSVYVAPTYQYIKTIPINFFPFLVLIWENQEDKITPCNINTLFEGVPCTKSQQNSQIIGASFEGLGAVPPKEKEKKK